MYCTYRFLFFIVFIICMDPGRATDADQNENVSYITTICKHVRIRNVLKLAIDPAEKGVRTIVFEVQPNLTYFRLALS